MSIRNLIYGKHTIDEFIQKHSNLIKHIWVVDRKALNVLPTNIPISVTSSAKLDAMFEGKVLHQNVVAEVKEYNYLPFNQLLEQQSNVNKSIILMVDQIHDPFNFGAIIRTASLLNIHNIIILDHKQVFVTPAVVKTSAGTVYDIKISKVGNLNLAISELKKHNYWIYSTNLHTEAVDIRTIEFANKSVIVIGNEHKGVSALVTKNADVNFFIPSNHNIDSYNANVAASLIMFWVANQIGNI